MVTIRTERSSDAVGREKLLDAAYGASRFTKTSERLREGRLPAEQLSFVAVRNGRLVGTVRLWHVWAGAGRSALLLGPLAVRPDFRNRGIGSTLMRHAIGAARRLGHGAVLLVGDAPYYARFGFAADLTAALWMPGRYEPDRLLALELRPGALAGARGLIGPAGAPAPKPDLSVLVAAETYSHRRVMRRAAWPGRKDARPLGSQSLLYNKHSREQSLGWSNRR
jgi:predicted N-acetyltransferase YhbS